jgi:DNA-binding winged helix-turn-helix (wHTH) protein/tetratricopeptide (TPR) repeat protein
MTQAVKRLYTFGPFCLDPAERILLRESHTVPLTPKVFDTLIVLITNSGHIVSKDELIKRVWLDTFIDEGTLTRTVSRLRRALGEAPGGQAYIETVPRLGYRFVVNVSESLGAGAALRIDRQTRSRIIIEEKEETHSLSRRRAIGSLRRNRIALTLAALLIVMTGTIFYWWMASRSTATSAERQSRSPNHPDTNHIEADEAYRAGRDLWNKRTAAGLFQSIEKFEQAIEKDPDFALAYDGLADAYAFDLARWRQAEELAKKALEIDSRLAEPHATLGFVRTFWEWNWKEAEQEFKRAIKLNPNYATAHQWYAVYLAVTARIPEAELEMRRAAELEPLSPVMNADLGQILYFAQKPDEAIAACRKALDIDADFFNAHQYLYQIYIQQQRYDEALDELVILSSLPGVTLNGFAANRFRKAYKARGIRGFWQARLEDLHGHTGDAYEMAECYARLGEQEQALDWLKKAFDQRNFNCIYLHANPAFYDFYLEPEFLNLKRRMDIHE